nr:hypothetical protein CFP56_07717 [Quercus suber]
MNCGGHHREVEILSGKRYRAVGTTSRQRFSCRTPPGLSQYALGRSATAIVASATILLSCSTHKSVRSAEVLPAALPIFKISSFYTVRTSSRRQSAAQASQLGSRQYLRMADPGDEVVLSTTEESLDIGLQLQHSRDLPQTNAGGEEEDRILDSDWHDFLEDIRLLIPYELDGYKVYLKIRHYAQRLVTLAEYDIDFAGVLPDKHDNDPLASLVEHVKEIAERNERIAFDFAWEGFAMEASEARPGCDHVVSEMRKHASDNLQTAQHLCERILPHYRLNAGRRLKEFIQKTREDVKELGPTLDLAGLDGNWHYEWSIGEGAYGEAGLWVRTDQNGSIVERMVIKDVFLTQEEWMDKSQWYRGNHPATKSIVETPIKAHIQSLMTIVSNGRSIVLLRTFAVIPNRRLYRRKFCSRSHESTAS